MILFNGNITTNSYQNILKDTNKGQIIYEI